MPFLLCRFSLVLALLSALLGDRSLCMCLTVVRAPRVLDTALASACILHHFKIPFDGVVMYGYIWIE